MRNGPSSVGMTVGVLEAKKNLPTDPRWEGLARVVALRPAMQREAPLEGTGPGHILVAGIDTIVVHDPVTDLARRVRRHRTTVGIIHIIETRPLLVVFKPSRSNLARVMSVNHRESPDVLKTNGVYLAGSSLFAAFGGSCAGPLTGLFIDIIEEPRF